MNSFVDRPIFGKGGCRPCRGQPHARKSRQNSPIVVRVELHPKARAEVRAAALWDEEQRPGLGDRFVGRVNEVLQRLEQAPALYPGWPEPKRLPSRFTRPFSTSSRKWWRSNCDTESVLVLAVAHASGNRYTGSLERAKGPANTRMEPTRR